MKLQLEIVLQKKIIADIEGLKTFEELTMLKHYAQSYIDGCINAGTMKKTATMETVFPNFTKILQEMKKDIDIYIK